MAEIAEKFCDHVIVTQDNPRTENPEKIIEDILSGFSSMSVQGKSRQIKSSQIKLHQIKIEPEIKIEPDRALAIQYAVQQAEPQDLIVVAGKGHEMYQIIGQQKLPFSDQLVVEEALNARDKKQGATAKQSREELG